jgi:hypothetical protein
MLDKTTKDLYSFFSHNIRTFNAEIVTTIECLKVGFIDKDSEEFDTVYEASYLLDLYDSCLSIILDYLDGAKIEKKSEEVDIVRITEEFLSSIKGYLTASGLNIVKNFNDEIWYTDSYIFKNIYKIVLYEFIKTASKGINVNIAGAIEIEADEIIGALPDIFKTFQEIFDKIGFKLKFDNKKIVLEYLS